MATRNAKSDGRYEAGVGAWLQARADYGALGVAAGTSASAGCCHRYSVRKAVTASTAWLTYGWLSYKSMCSLASSQTIRFGSRIRW
jgi:hypothetical protein